ncbi:MAG: isochorismatase [Caldilineaceae bacterium SB0662_bin_9]|uniref:Isochorismatase n=1 Tax=Caldilineaceae bacterium SB0662_bin_9 TaxID=2605258 RepID=A0A6B1DPI8_9CHLR|nr:isochorismatase [Caldilineaceae bacterium SB0662_bin_9]
MSEWARDVRETEIEPARSAILVCDVWDRHWSKGANLRLVALLPRMEDLLNRTRSRGFHIVHAPSDTLEFYADSPARKRIAELSLIPPPADAAREDPPLPINDQDGGSDSGEDTPTAVWTRQHPALTIDQDRDVVSDNGPEIWSWMQHTGIHRLFILGVHTNMCILNRTFGIKQMTRWNVPVALVRDLTDSMYNPACPPYVSHDAGTGLVIDYIEKFWCPTVHSQYLFGL